MPLIPNPISNSRAAQASANNTSSEKKIVQFPKTAPKYTFDDLILSDETLDELQTVVNAQKNWRTVFETWGLGNVIKERKNLFVNRYGASGTGKSMSAHAIASALNKNLICVNYADIESKYVGETSKNLSSLFQDPGNRNEIIFFDEADALLSKRVTDMSSAADVSVNQIRSFLLTLLNFYEGMVIFATNFISNYDPAFMRRIQYHILYELPNSGLRERLWIHYIPPQMPVQADLHILAEKYDGLSGSDISNAVMKAALRAAHNNAKAVTQNDFEEAVKSILSGKAANSTKGERVKRVTEIVPEEEVPIEIRKRAEKNT